MDSYDFTALCIEKKLGDEEEAEAIEEMKRNQGNS